MALNRLQQWLTALVGPVQTIEGALEQLLEERRLGTAVGVQLDTIGRLVGQARGGLNDADFERYIRARIVANRASGTVDQVLQVIEAVLDDPGATVTIDQAGQYPAAFVVRIRDTVVSAPLAAVLVTFLRLVKAAGVRALLEPAMDADASLLYLDIDNLDQERFIPAME